MNLLSPVRVVVVDDKPTHLVSIANGLSMSGVPCVWHWYDSENHRLVPPAPEGGYPFLRMLFTDLNINDMTGADRDPKSLASALIAEVLQPVVSPVAGPYAICLWTSVNENAEAVGPIIIDRIANERIDAEDRRPAPLTVNILPKAEFLLADTDTEADIHLKKVLDESSKVSERLRTLVGEATLKDAQLRVVASWESRASYAAADTINNFYFASQGDQSDPSQASISLRKTMAKIAVEAGGYKNAKADPAGALDEALFDMFVDEMGSSIRADGYVGAVTEALADSLKSYPERLSAKSSAMLNAVLQIQQSHQDFDHIARGIVLDVNNDGALKAMGLNDRKSIIWDDFLFPVSFFEREHKIATEEGDTTLAGRLARDIETVKELRGRIDDESKIVLIELGTDCDHAQRKERTMRFLLGIEVPQAFSLYFSRPGGSRSEYRSEAVNELGPWLLKDDRQVNLLVSVRRFTAQQSLLRNKDVPVLYRLRKPIVDLLLHRYSTHSTRPGIIQIN